MYNEILEYHLYNILKSFFTTLSNTGYVSKDIVERIQVLIGLEELMNRSTSLFITTCDYKSMQKVVNCMLTGECLLPAMRTGMMSIGEAYQDEFDNYKLDDEFFIPDYTTEDVSTD